MSSPRRLAGPGRRPPQPQRVARIVHEELSQNTEDDDENDIADGAANHAELNEQDLLQKSPEQLVELLLEKEKNLTLAAEIGQALLSELELARADTQQAEEQFAELLRSREIEAAEASERLLSTQEELAAEQRAHQSTTRDLRATQQRLVAADSITADAEAERERLERDLRQRHIEVERLRADLLKTRERSTEGEEANQLFTRQVQELEEEVANARRQERAAAKLLADLREEFSALTAEHEQLLSSEEELKGKVAAAEELRASHSALQRELDGLRLNSKQQKAAAAEADSLIDIVRELSSVNNKLCKQQEQDRELLEHARDEVMLLKKQATEVHAAPGEEPAKHAESILAEIERRIANDLIKPAHEADIQQALKSRKPKSLSRPATGVQSAPVSSPASPAATTPPPTAATTKASKAPSATQPTTAKPPAPIQTASLKAPAAAPTPKSPVAAPVLASPVAAPVLASPVAAPVLESPVAAPVLESPVVAPAPKMQDARPVDAPPAAVALVAPSAQEAAPAPPVEPPFTFTATAPIPLPSIPPKLSASEADMSTSDDERARNMVRGWKFQRQSRSRSNSMNASANFDEPQEPVVEKAAAVAKAPAPVPPSSDVPVVRVRPAKRIRPSSYFGVDQLDWSMPGAAASIATAVAGADAQVARLQEQVARLQEQIKKQDEQIRTLRRTCAELEVREAEAHALAAAATASAAAAAAAATAAVVQPEAADPTTTFARLAQPVPEDPTESGYVEAAVDVSAEVPLAPVATAVEMVSMGVQTMQVDDERRSALPTPARSPAMSPAPTPAMSPSPSQAASPRSVGSGASQSPADGDERMAAFLEATEVLWQRMACTDTVKLNRLLRRAFDLSSLHTMSQSLLDNILDDISIMSSTFGGIPMVPVMQRILFDNVFLRKTINDYTLTYVTKLDQVSHQQARDAVRQREQEQEQNSSCTIF